MARETQNPDSQIEFRFVKSNQHRVVHVDGAWGGLTQYGGIHMSVFSEIQEIPSSVTHAIEAGKLGGELSRHGGEAITRELEVTLLMSLSAAISMRDWLTGKIETAQQALESSQRENR